MGWDMIPRTPTVKRANLLLVHSPDPLEASLEVFNTRPEFVGIAQRALFNQLQGQSGSQHIGMTGDLD